jgi:hypothetical protein
MAKTENLTASAQIHGWINAYFLHKKITRQPNELRAMSSTAALLREHLAPDLFTQFCAQGAQLSEDEVCKIAVM